MQFLGKSLALCLHSIDIGSFLCQLGTLLVQLSAVENDKNGDEQDDDGDGETENTDVEQALLVVHLFYLHLFLQGLVFDVEFAQLLVDVALFQGVSLLIGSFHGAVSFVCLAQVVEALGLGGEEFVLWHRHVDIVESADAVKQDALLGVSLLFAQHLRLDFQDAKYAVAGWTQVAASLVSISHIVHHGICLSQS